MYRRTSSQSGRRGAIVALLTVLLIVIGGLAVWNNLLRHHVFPKNFGIVEAGHVYRSGYLEPAMLRKVVEEKQIKTVIDLGGSQPGTSEHAAEVRMAESLGVNRYELPLTGEEDDDPAYYAEVLALLADRSNHPVLVHCAAGADRTTAATILYDHIVRDRSVAETLRDSIVHYRHDPADNPGLLAYLIGNVEEIRRLYEELREAPAATEVRGPAEPKRSPSPGEG